HRFASAGDMAAARPRLGLPGFPGARPGQDTRRIGPVGAHPDHRSAVFRCWMLVPLLLVLLAATAIVIGILAGRLELGGPLGVRAKPHTQSTETPTGTPSGYALDISGVRAFDPFGDGQEHDELVHDAIDGNPDTFWETENYNQTNLAPKPGVGLLFDLGSSRTVTGFQLETPNPGFHFEIR